MITGAQLTRTGSAISSRHESQRVSLPPKAAEIKNRGEQKKTTSKQKKNSQNKGILLN